MQSCSVSEFVLIFLGACLVNNLALDHLLGICPGAALSRKIDVAIDFSRAAMFALAIASVLGYVLHVYLLRPLQLEHLELIVLVFSILAVLNSGTAFLERFRPDSYRRIAVFIPLLLVNCSIVGAALLSIREPHGLIGSLAFGLGSGAGLGLVMLMLAAAQDRLEGADVPAPFRGTPVLLLTLALLSLAFMGFTGLTVP